MLQSFDSAWNISTEISTIVPHHFFTFGQCALNLSIQLGVLVGSDLGLLVLFVCFFFACRLFVLVFSGCHGGSSREESDAAVCWKGVLAKSDNGELRSVIRSRVHTF